MDKFEEKKTKQESKKFHKAIKRFTMDKRHSEKRENLAAIEKLKSTVREKGGDVTEKEFDKIMKTGSKAGLDTEKGQRSKPSTKVIDQVKAIPRVKKGEAGRIGSGRFNKDFEATRAEMREKAQAKKVGGGFKREERDGGFRGGRGGGRGGFRGGRSDSEDSGFRGSRGGFRGSRGSDRGGGFRGRRGSSRGGGFRGRGNRGRGNFGSGANPRYQQKSL